MPATSESAPRFFLCFFCGPLSAHQTVGSKGIHELVHATLVLTSSIVVVYCVTNYSQNSLKLIQNLLSHSYYGSEVQERLRWEVLNQSLSWDTVRILARATGIRTGDWGSRTWFQDSSLAGLCQETSVLCHMDLSRGLFIVVPDCQLTSSVWVSEGEQGRKYNVC